MRTAQLNVRTDPKVKSEAASILKKIGMTTSEAINLFLHRIVMEKGIPFDVKIPNEETIKAMEDIEKGRDLESAKTVDEMFDKIGVKI